MVDHVLITPRVRPRCLQRVTSERMRVRGWLLEGVVHAIPAGRQITFVFVLPEVITADRVGCCGSMPVDTASFGTYNDTSQCPS